MSQHDYNIANQTFSATRTDLNNALGAVATNNAGNSAPSTTYASQWWFDSDGNTLYMRNKDNDAWVTVLTIGATSDKVESIGVDDLIFADNSKLILGTGSDLQIYHDGSHSYVQDTGTGHLRLAGDNVQIVSAAIDENYIICNKDGAVDIYHNNVKKLETTSTGIAVTGEITATGPTTITVTDNSDNLTLTSTDADANAGPNLRLYRNSSSPADDDLTGTIDFEWRNDNSQDVVGFQISNFCRDVSDGAEENIALFHNMFNGTLTEFLRVDSQSDQSVVTFNELSNNIDFRVEGDNATHMLFVDASLDEVMVGGNGEQNARFSVQQPEAGDKGQVLTCTNTSYTGTSLDIGVSRNTTNNTYYFLKCQRRGFAYSLLVADSGNVTNLNNSYGAISDERLKTNITDANSQWDDIKALKVRNYKMLQDPTQTTQIGVISQELETAGMNGLINENEADEYQIAAIDDESILKAGDNVKEVRYSVLYMKAIKALQEAMTKIEDLEARVTTLEG